LRAPNLPSGQRSTRQVSTPRVIHRPAQLLCLAAALSGCATYSKCGFHGCPGDAGLTAKVEAQLEQYPALEAPNSVRAQALDHVVYLYGLVDTDLERELAESVATSAAGGARIVDSIAVNDIGK
jgi:osmotically-inducible protein OsmY